MNTKEMIDTLFEHPMKMFLSRNQLSDIEVIIKNNNLIIRYRNGEPVSKIDLNTEWTEIYF